MGLPSGYKQLAYIESTGTQYIDTGFVPDSNSRMVIDFAATDVSVTNNIAGSRSATTSKVFTFSTTSGYWRIGYNTSSPATSVVADTNRHTADLNKNVLSLDGTAIYTATAATFTGYASIYICAIHASATGYMGYVKIYSCKIYDNGTLIRDYVPCLNDSGEAGLYDLVNAEFYGDAAGGAFTAGPVVVKLPAGYTQVEYIESAGTQYIDTGFNPKYDSRVVMDISGLGTDQQWLFGARDSTASTAANQFCLYRSSATAMRSDYFKTNASLTVSDTTARATIDKNENVVSLFGGTITNTAVSSGECSYPMYLFTVNNAGAIHANKATMKLYSCQIYDSGKLVRDYVPARYSDGTAGLYDVANDEFYTNAGTGTFAVGEDIIAPDIEDSLSAPNDFTASASVDSISLSWGAVDGAVGYVLHRNGTRIADTTETEYTDNTAKPYRVYTYAVSAYDESGEGSPETLKASVLEPDGFLTVDYRTAVDVERVKNLQNRIKGGKATNEEIAEWLDGLIGAYNAWDMNRVESAVDYLQTYLNGVQAALDAYRAERMVASDDFWVAPWDAISLFTKKDWSIEDIPSESDLARYLSNVDAVTNALAIAKRLPETMEKLNYNGANEIERVLRAEYDAGVAYEANAKRLIDNTQAAFVYSGEIFGGEF